MREQTRTRVANGLERARLLRPAERLREEWLTIRAHDDHLAYDGLPVPPARLRLLVDGRSGDAGHYLRVGRQMHESICAAVESMGRPAAELGAVLDFGCGCGRVARHWTPIEGPEVHGCDYNPELVSWCARNLPALWATRNQLTPPTPYVSGSFDLIYALSVFSHLDEKLQQAWLAEYRRLLRPGGLLVLSLIGESLRGRLDAAERRRFDGGELVVQRPRLAGRNLCTVYHPRAHVMGTLLAGFDDVRPFELGSAELPMLQDAYIARC